MPLRNQHIRAVLAQELRGQSAHYGRRLTYTLHAAEATWSSCTS